MQARFMFAKNLLRDQRLDEATEQFEWLWKNMARVQPAMAGVRLSYLVEEVKTLILAHPPARARFEAIRDETGAAADANPGLHAPRLDGVALNQMLGDDDATLAWFDAVKDDPLSSLIFEAVGDNLTELLKRRGRVADICRLFPDPMAQLERLGEMRRLSDMPLLKARLGGEAYEQMQNAMARSFRSAVLDLVTALRAAGRNDEADAVKARALALDPSEETKRALAQGADVS
jgi:hypothetical protein